MLILSISPGLSDSSIMNSALRVLEIQDNIASSRDEFTRDHSDSLYLGRPSVSYLSSIGQPIRVPTQISDIFGLFVNPDNTKMLGIPIDESDSFYR